MRKIVSIDMGEAFGGDNNVPADPFENDTEVEITDMAGNRTVHFVPATTREVTEWQVDQAGRRQERESGTRGKIDWRAVVSLDQANSALIPLLNSAWRLKEDTARQISKNARHGSPDSASGTNWDLEEAAGEIRHLALDMERQIVTILNRIENVTHRI